MYINLQIKCRWPRKVYAVNYNWIPSLQPNNLRIQNLKEILGMIVQSRNINLLIYNYNNITYYIKDIIHDMHLLIYI